MDTAIVELAKLFRTRDNVSKENFVVGNVVSPYPNLKINDGDEILLTKNNLIVAEHLLSHSRMYMLSNEDGTVISGTITFTDTLKAGEKVIMIPSSDGQKYIVLDKAVSL